MIVVPKRYCIDFESDVEKLEVSVVGNLIYYQDISANFYKIYIWQQLLINELLEYCDSVILQIEYIDFDFTKTLTILDKFDISKERLVSAQCKVCQNRVKCKQFQQAMVDDFVVNAVSESNDKLYTTYVALEGRIEALNAIAKTLKDQLYNEIERAKDKKLVLGTLGLKLSIKQLERDDFPFDIALKNNLLEEGNCKIKIGEMRKKVKGTEFEKYIRKVFWQNRLIVE